MTSDNRPLVPPRLVLGLIIFLLGGLFLADSAGLLRADSALDFWPVALIALGLVVVLQPDPPNRMVGALLLIAGVWLLLNAIGVWSYWFWRTWPYLLIVFGGWMISRAYQMRAREAQQGTIAGFAFLNSVDRQPSVPITGGEFSAVAGGCSIDLRGANVDGANPTIIIDVFALFGRIALQVPADWSIDSRVLPLIGRVDEPSPPPASAGPTVIVQGSAIFGSVVVEH